jgi:activator of 2-hydroxyglutaryl-CoA dehydratase
MMKKGSSVNAKNGSKKLYVGIDVGSVSLNGVIIDRDKTIIYESPYRRHFGKVEQETISFIQRLLRQGSDGEIMAVAFTGNHGQKISESFGCSYEFETISQVNGALFIRPDVKTIISMGGQDTALFQINHDENGWDLDAFNTNGPCASGTAIIGFLQNNKLELNFIEMDLQLSLSDSQKMIG